MAVSKHISILDPMRGIAALAVVLFHYSGAILPSINPDLLTGFFSYGHLGVQVFFVISGFVIPYALHRSNYSLGQYGNFMARRVIRIAPPAYVAAGLMILYYELSIVVNGQPVAGWEFPGYGLQAIITNLTFTSEYFPPGWYNFVFWTLTAEFEFYIAIGLLYPLIMNSKDRWTPVLVILLLLLLAQTASLVFFNNVEYFVIGLLVFLAREHRVDRWSLIALAVVSCGLAVMSGKVLAPVVALFAAGIIMSGTSAETGFTNWLGRISYSLYIIHAPVGYFAESAMKRVTDLHLYPYGKVLLLFFYAGIALLSAGIFYRYVEGPFIKWSKAMARGRRPGN